MIQAGTGELFTKLESEKNAPVADVIFSGAKVEIVYPEEGTVILPASAAVIKGANNSINAKLLIDFVISKEIRDILGTTTTNRSVRKDAEISENMKALNEIKKIEEDMEYVIEHKAELV